MQFFLMINTFAVPATNLKKVIWILILLMEITQISPTLVFSVFVVATN